MRMRWVITAKGEGYKARLVLLGFQDPRLGLMKTASPTVSRRGRHIFLAMAASFRWKVEKGDVKCAFLQGTNKVQFKNEKDEGSRQKVYAEPVPESRKFLNIS